VARLIMRVFDSILPARGAPLAELCNVLLLAEADDRKAISQPAQNPSAQPSRAISKFNTEDLGHFTAEQSPENAYEKGIGHLGTGRGIPMLLQSAIVRLCLAVVVIVAASVSVFDVLALRPAAEKLAIIYAPSDAASPGSTGASVPSPAAIRAIVAAAAATDQNHTLKSPGEPQGPERSPDPELTERLTLSTSTSAESPDLTTAAKCTANERTPEMRPAAPPPIPAAQPPAAAPVVPDYRSAPKPDAAPALAKLEMPKSMSPNLSVSPDAPLSATVSTVAAPTAVTPPSEPRASTAETAALLARGDSLRCGRRDFRSTLLRAGRRCRERRGGAAIGGNLRSQFSRAGPAARGPGRCRGGGLLVSPRPRARRR
jgi:hypothetical protein